MIKLFVHLFIIILFSHPTHASTIIPPDKSRIAKVATHIFVGKVTHLEVKDLAGYCNAINHTATIEVVENIRGTAEGKITLPVCSGNKAFNKTLRNNSFYIFFLAKNGDKYQRVYPTGGIVEF